MEKSIVDFIAALTNIDRTYIRLIGLNHNNEAYQQAAEGAFTAELYHQWKSIINNDVLNYYQGLQIHYDLTKERFEGKRPDLVLHTAPNSRNNQKLYVEVKTSRSTANYFSDFDKIFLAVSPDNDAELLGYQNAVFLSTTAYYDAVKLKIQNYLTQINLKANDERLLKIYSIHLNDDYSIIIKTFAELI